MDKLIFLLLFGLASVSSSQLPNGCPADFSVHILLPHESDCGLYYMCSNGHKHLFQCPGGTLFDFELQGCDWAQNVNCQQQTTTAPTVTDSVESTSDSADTDDLNDEFHPNGCPVDMHINLLLAHEYDCTKFYQCAHGNKVLHQCPAQLYFDVELQVCNWAHLVDCQLITTRESLPTTTEATSTTEPTTAAVTEVTTVVTEEVTVKTTTEIPSTNDPITEPTVTDSPTATESVITTTEATYSTEPVTVEIIFTTEMVSTIEPTELLTTTAVTEDLTTIETTEYTTSPELTTKSETSENETTTQDDRTTTERVPENLTTPGSATTGTTEPDLTTEYETTTQDNTNTTEIVPGNLSTPEVTTESAEPESQICPEGYFGSVPDPYRCDTFYLCTLWAPILLSCPENMEFDPNTRVCVPIAEGGCTWNQTNSTTTTQASWETSTPNIVTTTETFGTTEYEGNVSTVPVEVTTVFYSTTLETSSNYTEGITEGRPNITTEGVTEELTVTTEAWLSTEYSTTLNNVSTVDLTTILTTIDTSNNITVPPEITTDGWFTNSTIVTESGTTLEVTTELYETTEGTEPTPQICPDGFFGTVPHPDRCDAYYLCSAWNPILLYCPNGFEFDPVVMACVIQSESGCKLNQTSTSTTPENPITTNSTNATPEILVTTENPVTYEITTESTNATTENSATTNITTELVDTTTELVNFTTENPVTVVVTNDPEETTEPSNSAEGSTEDIICPDWYFGTVPNPNDCQGYYLCYGWEPIPLYCQSGFEYDPETGECVLKSEGGCTWQSTSTVQPTEPTEEESGEYILPGVPGAPGIVTEVPEPTTEPEAPEICPPGFFGMVANPDDCTSYFLCSLWEPIPLACPAGFEFSLVEQRCVQSIGAGCKGQNENVIVDYNDFANALYGDTHGVNIIDN